MRPCTLFYVHNSHSILYLSLFLTNRLHSLCIPSANEPRVAWIRPPMAFGHHSPYYGPCSLGCLALYRLASARSWSATSRLWGVTRRRCGLREPKRNFCTAKELGFGDGKAVRGLALPTLFLENHHRSIHPSTPQVH